MVEVYAYRHTEVFEDVGEFEILFGCKLVRENCTCPPSRVVHDHFLLLMEVDVNDDAPNYEQAVENELESAMDYILELMCLKEYLRYKRHTPYPLFKELEDLHREVILGVPFAERKLSVAECAAMDEYVLQERRTQVMTQKYFDYQEVEDMDRIMELIDGPRLVML